MGRMDHSHDVPCGLCRRGRQFLYPCLATFPEETRPREGTAGSQGWPQVVHFPQIIAVNLSAAGQGLGWQEGASSTATPRGRKSGVSRFGELPRSHPWILSTGVTGHPAPQMWLGSSIRKSLCCSHAHVSQGPKLSLEIQRIDGVE